MQKRVPPLARPPYRERVLLYSLWAGICLVALIYTFWPAERSPAGKWAFLTPSPIEVRLAPELHGWFRAGHWLRSEAQAVEVELGFQDKPLDSLTSVHRVELGYDLGRNRQVLYRGAITWSPAENRIPSSLGDKRRAHSGTQPTPPPALRLVLPNPQGAAPEWVRIYFGDSH